MSQGDIAWNAFYDKYNKEPETAHELYEFAHENDQLQDIDSMTATDTFNKNTGKGYIKHVKVPSEIDIVYDDVEISRAVSSELPPDTKINSKPIKSRKESSLATPTLDTPIPTEVPKMQMLSTHSVDSHDLHPKMLTANSHSNPTSEDVNSPDISEEPSKVIESLETEISDNSVPVKLGFIGRLLAYGEWLVLGFSIFVLLMVIIILPSVSSTLNGKMDDKQSSYTDTLSAQLNAYEAVDSIDEAQTIYVGNYYGWSFAWYRNAAYRKNNADSQGGNDVQYPFPDIRVRYGDKLVFKRLDEHLADNLLLVPYSLYKDCDFTDYTDADGDIPDDSEILLASANELWNEYGNASYVFKIEENNTLITSDTLYFTSSYKWDSRNGQACLGGLKLKVIIDRSYRKKMPVKRSSDKWRGIASTETVQEVSASIGHVARVVMLKQFSDEQRIRSDGDSGISNVKQLYDGNNAYDDGTYFTDGTAAIHDHAENLLAVGMGQFQAVLNGVEFTTRHNDYNLVMPSTTSSEYGATEAIEYPDVPPEVTGSVDAQIEEMQKWFKAFKDQDNSERDYTKYFKPILCYLEGTWIEQDSDDTFAEPFESDLNEFGPSTNTQLNDLQRFMINSGRKSIKEDIGHLPSSIRNIEDNTYPTISNWEYRIICHPLKDDLPLARLRVSNDLNVQLFNNVPLTREEIYYDKRARFDLNKYVNLDDIHGDTQWAPGRKKWNYLDYLMEQIPGKDNYIGNITDDLPDGTGTSLHYLTDERINSAYYSRFYKLSGADAMGGTGHRRSWCDRILFAAKTTQTNVSPIKMTFEVEAEDEETGEEQILFYPTISRWSYAIPLEIIYLTPLTKWNPYKISEKDRDDFDYDKSGECTSDHAFNGYTSDNAYFTPAGFYAGSGETISADTAMDNRCAKGSDGSVYNVVASGHYVVLPEIGGGVGYVRQRYPIFHIHNGGSNEHKEIKALQEIVLKTDYDDATSGVDVFDEDKDNIYGFDLSLQGGDHQHKVYVPGWKVAAFWSDSDITSDDYIEIEVDEADQHQHVVRIWRNKGGNGEWVYHLKQCRLGRFNDIHHVWMTEQCSDDHDTLIRY